MSLTDGVWKLWREVSGFWQRYTGAFSDACRTIKALGGLSGRVAVEARL
jgi:hypothetical protein